MANDNIKVGGVALEITLDDSHINQDAEKAAKKTRKKFSGELAGAGAEADKAFKKSFTGVTGSGSSAAKKIRQSFSTDMRAAGKDVERSLRQSFDNAGSAGGSMAESLVGGLKRAGAAALALFSVQKLKEFGQSAIEQAAHVTALDSQLTQTFREYEGAAVKAIRRVAEESGILDTRLQGVGTQIYAFAKTSRMDSVTALNMMEDALRVAADSAAYYDRSLEETSETLKSFLKGNYANDAALGVSATETTRNAAAMELYGKSFQNLSEAQKQLTLLQMVNDANTLSGAVGQAARESEGWENVIGNLKEAWNQLLAAVGKPILQGAVAVIKQLTEWITKLATWAQAASQALGELFGWDSSPTAQTAADTAQTAGSIAESVDNQNALTQAVAKTNAEVKRGIAGFDKLNVISKSTAQQAENNADQGIDSGLNGFAGGSALSLDTTDAENKIEQLKDKINGFFRDLYEKSGMKNFAEKFSESFERIDYDEIRDNFTQIGADVSEIAAEVAPGVEEMNKAFAGLSGSVLGLGNTVVGKALEIFSGGVRKWLDKDKEYISETTDTVTHNLSSGFGNLTPIFDDLGERANKFFEALQPITEGVIADALSGLTHYLGEMAKKGSYAFAVITGWLKDFYYFTTNDFVPGIKNAFMGMYNNLADILNSIWNAAYQTVRKLGEILKGIGSFIGFDNWGWDMPESNPVNIPRFDMSSAHDTTHSFASGGIVKAPTLAVVGDNPGAGSGNPEVIAPLNKLQSMINTSNGQDTVILSNILDMLTRIYEMFVIFRSQGGNVYEFAAQLNGNDLFREVVRQNELYKKSHRGRSAF